MKGFIEVHDWYGDRCQINVRQIVKISQPARDTTDISTTICCGDFKQGCRENYDEICKKIAEALE